MIKVAFDVWVIKGQEGIDLKQHTVSQCSVMLQRLLSTHKHS